jgi:probable F420-dependent oxidoreductase
MATIDLGPVGVALDPSGGEDFLAGCAEVEQLGYSTLWLTGGSLPGLDRIADVVGATTSATVASGIIAVHRFPADEVVALHAGLETTHPGRFVAGLGGAHDAHPLATLNAYLDRLDAADPPVPASRRVLAALGPKMLDLARERSSGAFPVLVTPDYTAEARARLGDGVTLAVEQLVVVDTDPATARATARRPLGYLAQMPQYQASFRRMGFAEDVIAGVGDPLVDALVPWGDAEAVAARVRQQLDAGADHVALSLVGAPVAPGDLAPFRAVAEALALT